MEGENGTEEEETGRQLLDVKGLRPGTQMLATQLQEEPEWSGGKRAGFEGRRYFSLLDEAR